MIIINKEFKTVTETKKLRELETRGFVESLSSIESKEIKEMLVQELLAAPAIQTQKYRPWTREASAQFMRVAALVSPGDQSSNVKGKPSKRTVLTNEAEELFMQVSARL